MPTPTIYPIGTGNTAGTTSQSSLPTTAPIGSVASNGNASFTSVGTDPNGNPIWSQLPAGYSPISNQTPAGTQGSQTGTGSSGITSSASLQNYVDQASALYNALPGLSSQQQASINSTGAAAQQTIAAQGAAGDTQFQQAIQSAQTAEAQALGNATVSGAQSNPTGTQSMQTFSPYSPAGQAQGLQANSTYSGMKASISNQFQQTIGDLQSQQASYDESVAAGESTAAAQTQSNAITAANTMIQNQLSTMNNMMNVAMGSQSLQLQQEANSQNFQVGMANYQLQLQANQQNQATGQMNTILSSFAGTGAEGGWNAMTPIQQTQMTTLATQAGIPVSLVQGMVNQTKATSLTTVQDPFGNTTLVGTDSSGKEVSSQYVGGGVTPGSATSNAIASSYGTQYSDIGAQFFTTNSAKYSPYMVAAGYKNLPATSATAFQGQYSAYTNLNQVQNVLQSMSQLATSPGDLVSDYPSRTLNELLQVNPSQTQNPTQFSADLATLNSLNPSLYKAITSIQGLSGGIGLSALLNSSGNLLLNPNNTLQTNMQNVENLQGQLETTMQATYGGGLTFPSSSQPATTGSSFSSFLNGGGAGTSSGSTDPLNLGISGQ